MKNHNNVIAALAGVLVGTVIGAGAMYSADLVSYRYSDGDSLFREIRTKHDIHQDDGARETVGTRHGAARGEKLSIPEECEQFTGQRRTRCIGADGNYQDSDLGL